MSRDLALLLVDTMWKKKDFIFGNEKEKRMLFKVVEKIQLINDEVKDVQIEQHLDLFNRYIQYRAYGYSTNEAYRLIFQ